MELPITQFRAFPNEKPINRLSRITPMDVINYAEGGLENTGLLEEMTRAWEADWDRDFGPAPDIEAASTETSVK